MKQNRTHLFLTLIVIILTAQACLIPVPDWNLFANLGRFLCTNLTGKEWLEDEDGGRCLSPPELAEDQAAVEAEAPGYENQPAGSQEPVFADPASCNAYGEVSLTPPIAKESESSSEIRCQYSLEFTNTSDQTIWLFLHEHNRFMNNEEAIKWDNYLNLSPGASEEIKGDYTVRKSDQAVSAHILDKVALIYATEGCINTFKNNSEAKDLIAAETPNPCQP